MQAKISSSDVPPPKKKAKKNKEQQDTTGLRWNWELVRAGEDQASEFIPTIMERGHYSNKQDCRLVHVPSLPVPTNSFTSSCIHHPSRCSSIFSFKFSTDGEHL